MLQILTAISFVLFFHSLNKLTKLKWFRANEYIKKIFPLLRRLVTKQIPTLCSTYSSGCLLHMSIQNILTVGRMVRYYFALAYKMVKMSKSAFLLKMEVPESENLS